MTADPGPHASVERFVEVVPAGERHPLLDPAGRRVVRVLGAADRIPRAEGFGEAETGVRSPEVAVPGPVEDHVGGGARVRDRDVGPVGLVSDDVRVGLLDVQAGRADVHVRDDPVRVARGARAGDAALAHGRERRVGPEIAGRGDPVTTEVGRIEIATGDDERAAVAGNGLRWVELEERISRVTDLAAQFGAEIDILERTRRGDVRIGGRRGNRFSGPATISRGRPLCRKGDDENDAQQRPE